LRYDDVLEKIIKEELELTQAYRFFIFFNPWTQQEALNQNKQ
jgi:hypothetical protein